MPQDAGGRDAPGPNRKWIGIFAAIVILFLVVGSIVMTLQGSGEAVGIEQAAPGGANADPPPDAR